MPEEVLFKTEAEVTRAEVAEAVQKVKEKAHEFTREMNPSNHGSKQTCMFSRQHIR